MWKTFYSSPIGNTAASPCGACISAGGAAGIDSFKVDEETQYSLITARKRTAQRAFMAVYA
jgi:hypothetical protein